MDAIKKVFQPGREKDDEILYGDHSNAGQPDAGSGAFNAGVPQGENAPTLNTLPEHKKTGGGVLSQITNPGGEKYDANTFGGTATTGSTTGASSGATTGSSNVAGGSTTGVSSRAATGSNVAGSAGTGSVGSGARTGPASTATISDYPSSANTTATSTHHGNHGHDNSHLGRDAAVAGGAGLGAGALAHETSRKHDGDHYTSSGATPSHHHHHHHTTTGSSTSQSGAPITGNTSHTTTSHHHNTHDTNTSSPTIPRTTGYYASQGNDSAAVGGTAFGAGSVASHNPTSQSTGAYDSTHGNSAPQSGYSGNPATTGSAYAGQSESAPQASSQSGAYQSTPSATSATGTSGRHHGEAAALGGAAAGAGGVAAYEHERHHPSTSTTHQGSSTGGLSHHVHNDTTQPGTGRHDIGSASYGTQSGHATSHTHSTAPASSTTAESTATGPGLSHHVYNGISGHGARNDDVTAHGHGSATHDRSHNAGSGLASAATTGSTTSSNNPSSSLGGTSTGYDQPSSTSQTVTGSSVGNEPSTSSGYGGAGRTTHATIAAQEAAKRHPHATTANPSAGYASGEPASSTSIPDRSIGQKSTTGQPEHHYGRDAAIAGGAGAVGTGAYEAEKHHHHAPHTSSTGYASGTTPQGTTSGQPVHDSALANKLDPRVKNDPATSATSTTGVSGTSSGQPVHDSALANKLDPRVKNDADNSNKVGSGTSSGQPVHDSAALNKLDPRVKTDTAGTATHDKHHTGRDAALVGGAGAATGAGVYEADKHHNASKPSSTGLGSTTTATPQQTTSSSGYSSGTTPATQDTSATGTQYTGPVHKSNILNKLDPRVKPVASENESSDKHTGRDAALVGGTGAAAGAGLYESEKHHHSPHHATTGSGTSSSHHPHTTQSSTVSQVPTDSTSGPHQSGTLNKLDPRVKHESGATTQDPHHALHHTGRDAALAGGAGTAGGAGIYEAEKHHSSSHPSHSAYGSSTHQPYDQSTSQSTTGTSGPHQSGVLNKLDPRVPTGNTSSTTQHSLGSDSQHPSHTGRDAALAGGAGAATGAGIYEADKHHGTTYPTSGYSAGSTGAQTTGVPTQGYGSNTGPAPNTIGPHSSDVANIVDPRVQPDPALQGKHHTGTHEHTGASTAAGIGAGTGRASSEAHHHHGEKHHGLSGPSVREDDGHNKLHKEPKEKKEGFLHKILHPGQHHGKEGHHSETSSPSTTTGTGLPASSNQTVDSQSGLSSSGTVGRSGI